MTTKADYIKQCMNARIHRGPYRCGLDWCLHCSMGKTNELVLEHKAFLTDAPKPHFTTILLEPCTKYQAAKEIAEKAIRRIEETGVKGIWYLEIGVPKNCTWYEEFFTHYPIGRGDRILPHLHGFTHQYEGVLDDLFAIRRQVDQTEIGSGRNKNKSFEENIEYLTRYVRKRRGIKTHWWLNRSDDVQASWKTGDYQNDYLDYQAGGRIGESGWNESEMGEKGNDSDALGSVNGKNGLGNVFIRIQGSEEKFHGDSDTIAKNIHTTTATDIARERLRRGAEERAKHGPTGNDMIRKMVHDLMKKHGTK